MPWIPFLPENLVVPLRVVTSIGLGVGLLGVVVIILAVFLINRYRDRRSLNRALGYVLLRIDLPKPILSSETNAHQKLLEEISIFEQFLTTISQVKQPIIFEVALPHSGSEVMFFVSLPRKYVEAFQKTIRSFWPGSELVISPEDYNIFNPTGVSLGSSVTLRAHFYKPLKTYSEVVQGTSDPLDAFLAGFSKLKAEGEGLAYQVIITPVASKVNRRAVKALQHLREGKSFDKATAMQPIQVLQSLSPEETKKDDVLKPKPVDELLLKGLEKKLTKRFFSVNVRVVSSAETFLAADQILATTESAFHQFLNPNLNELEVQRAKGRGLNDLMTRFAFRIFDQRRMMILSAEELASIFHFPTTYTTNNRIRYLPARNAPTPVNIPSVGLVLGENVYQGQTTLVHLAREDRRRHCYIIGQTGTGKTTLMKNVIEQDMVSGEGVCAIDPHGDVAKELLGLIPKERANDVIFFNPGDPRRPLGLNILEYDPAFPEQKTFIINSLIEIIDKLYNLRETGGPMFEQYLRNALLLLMDDPSRGHTLIDVSRIFVDERFRKTLVAECQNYQVVEFWTKQAPVVGGQFDLNNMITWITSKLNPFITNDFVRPIIAQSKSTLNIREIMDQKKILIVSLSKGKIGETSAYLLGMTLVAKILAAAFARVDTPEEQRQDFYLYIDEFQSFAFKGIASILSEARKYRLALTLAHQYIKQLPEEIASAVFGNVGTMIAFRVGADDAEYLEKQFAPVFSKADLMNIPNYQAYCRLLIAGYISTPFTLRTHQPHIPNLELADKITELSALTYGRAREEIEATLRPPAPSSPSSTPTSPETTSMTGS